MAIADALLAAGADIEATTADTGRSPLLVAVEYERSVIASHLIRCGADPTAIDKVGRKGEGREDKVEERMSKGRAGGCQ
jgi:hypothetical protein